MDRLDLELYADRLARHAARIADDIAAARLRRSWSEIELRLRAGLDARERALLEAIGALDSGVSAVDDAALIERRRAQLDALAHAQRLVERLLAEARAARPRAGREAQSSASETGGATTTSRPPSSS